MPDSRPHARLGFLDAARGLAALLVLACHGLGPVPGAARLGQVGVLLFLIVSGFIIPASLEQGGSNATFWLRRFFRLFPLYWLSIALGYVYYRVGSPGVVVSSRADWLLNL